MRLRLVPQNTSYDFFSRSKMFLGFSSFLMLASIVSFLSQGLNFGIDFRGGTTLRTESAQVVNVAEYRTALQQLDLGDITISEVFDPNFREDQHVTMIRIQAQDGQEAISSDIVDRALETLRSIRGTRDGSMRTQSASRPILKSPINRSCCVARALPLVSMKNAS